MLWWCGWPSAIQVLTLVKEKKEKKKNFSIPTTPVQQKYNTVLMAFETPMVNRAVQLSTWGWYSLQCAKNWLFYCSFVNTPEDPRMVFWKMKMIWASFRSREDMWSLWVTNRTVLFFSFWWWGSLHLQLLRITIKDNFQCPITLTFNTQLISISCLGFHFLCIPYSSCMFQSPLLVQRTVNERSRFWIHVCDRLYCSKMVTTICFTQHGLLEPCHHVTQRQSPHPSIWTSTGPHQWEKSKGSHVTFEAWS